MDTSVLFFSLGVIFVFAILCMVVTMRYGQKQYEPRELPDEEFEKTEELYQEMVLWKSTFKPGRSMPEYVKYSKSQVRWFMSEEYRRLEEETINFFKNKQQEYELNDEPDVIDKISKFSFFELSTLYNSERNNMKTRPREQMAVASQAAIVNYENRVYYTIETYYLERIGMKNKNTYP